MKKIVKFEFSIYGAVAAVLPEVRRIWTWEWRRMQWSTTCLAVKASSKA